MTASQTDPTTPVAITPTTVAERPLSRTQELIWTSQRLAPRTPIANMGKLHRVRGPLDPDRLSRAFDLVVRASDALRSIVVDRPGTEPLVRVLASPPRPTEQIELPAGELDEWVRQRVAEPIDVRTCGYDSVVLRHGPDDWTWWLDLHHVITDAFSSALVYDAVSRVYAALGATDADAAAAAVTSELVEFGSHVEAVSARHGDENARARRAAFFADQATDGGPITPYGPRGQRTTAVTRLPVPVPSAIDESLDGPYRTLSRELSQLGLLATVTAAAIHRLDGRTSITLGLPIHHRSGRDAQRVIGPLMELSPMRVDIDPAASFSASFQQVYASIVGVLRHSKPGESREVPLDAVINVLTARFGDLAGFPTETSWVRSGHVESTHALRVQAYDYGDGLRLELDLNDGLSADGAHHRFPEHFRRLLDAAVETPDRTIGSVALATEDELAVLRQLNPPAPSAPEPRPVHEQVATQLRTEPDRPTAVHGSRVLTAGELDRRADALAHWLALRSIGRGSRVGLRLRRSLDVLVAIHGVLRAGAAFVMLDPDDPPARNDHIASDADLSIVLDRVPYVGVDDPVVGDGLPRVDLDDLAYVLYTSGSTGRPKGVPITHRGLADYLQFAAATYVPDEPLVMPLHSSLAFDLTITSLLLPQLVGGRTIVFDGDAVTALAGVANDPSINVLKATPSQLEILLRLTVDPLPLDVVVVGGEAFRRRVAEAFTDRCRPGVRVYNEYGPTEAVVGCMIHEWDPAVDVGADVPIGVASPGAEVFVLDASGHHAPIGTWGELYVRRPGLASGYLGLPELSALRFSPVASIDEQPVYRTGDRVRVERGVVVFGGRIDEQLSVRGVRLEPGEIEAALVQHPHITNAVVRVWTPGATSIERCVRCGLGTDVPEVAIDAAGVCTVCREFERIEPQAAHWFKTPADLDAQLEAARARAAGDYDCLHLLSGGKDSTYALYQLAERGWRIHALTLDNGYIAEGAKANIRRTVDDLGISHEFVTTDAMNAIFRDSLDRFSNVCNGCYKTIYTLATARAHELGIPVIATGLSRGQFFETRLLPHQFEAERFDPEAIDHTVVQARRAYHHTNDAVTTLLPEQSVFELPDHDVLDEITYLDFYRYVDVELADMYEFLEQRAPWVRPDDTGRSTNCLINVAGIHVHRHERGYHNYAEPYSWDVRLGHKTREEAREELDDEIDLDAVERILSEIGYEPKRIEILTAWYETTDHQPLDPLLLRSHLRDALPDRAIPTAFVHVDELPLAESAKLDAAALPAPARVHTGSAHYVPPTTPTEVTVAEVWARILDVDRVGRDDDFFDLGGASLAALEAIAALESALDTNLPDELVFRHRLLRDFAATVDLNRGRSATAAEIPPLDADERPPLTPGEEAMLFEYRAAPDDTRYNVTRLYAVPAELDLPRLHRAVATVVERHGALHTAFDPERTVLAVDDALSFDVMPDGEPEAFANRQRSVPFDLDRGPLVRVHVDRSPGTTHVLIGAHHICIDAGTFDTFWNEVEAAYHERTLPKLEVTTAAHGRWQRAQWDLHEPFWYVEADRSEQAGGVTLPRPDEPEPDGYIERGVGVSAGELAQASVTTPFAASLAAAASVLGAYSRTGTVELGITASTKDHPAVEALVGYYLNTLPVMVEAHPEVSLRELDAAASRIVADVLPHRSLPVARIVQNARSRGAVPPDVSLMLAYEHLAPARWADGEADLRILASGTSVSDLTFFVQERGDELRVGIEYRGATVGADTAAELLDEFEGAIVAICRRPHRAVSAVQSRSHDDLVGPALAPPEKTVLAQFVDLAREQPMRTAVIGPDGAEVTAGDLLARAEDLAARVLGAVPQPRRVGVAVRRSTQMIEAILAAQLAGAAYVPVDPTVPAHRIAEILEGARPDVVIVDAGSAVVSGDHSVIEHTQGPAIDPIDAPTIDPDAGPRTLSPSGERRMPSLDDEAYVIFTSGSTGRPTGVAVTHRNLAASTGARAEFYGATPPERFLLTSSIGFDSSIVGLFWPLSTGGAIVIPSDDDVHDVDRLAELVAHRRVTHLLMVPSLYHALLERRPASLRGLHTAIVAGEACPAALVATHHRELPDVGLANEYGPTEATVWAAAHRCAPGDDPVPIGRPIAGVTLRVADDHLRPMPSGAIGELLVSGPTVTAGDIEGRSTSAFVEVDDRRWYRTGDLVRLDRRGHLVFVGRSDDQLNVGGARVEPTELEGHLSDVAGIEDGVVVAAQVAGRAVLVAHCVADRSRVDVQAVRSHLRARVAEAAVPRHVVFHDSLPRTPHGKIDRRRAAELPIHEPDDDASTGALVAIWRAALGRPDLGDDADFFAAGGDSIAAVEVVNALADHVGHEVAVSSLLRAPTPARMAELLGIGDDRSTVASVQLVTMRPGQPGGPTVILTAAWDDVQGYRDLADALPSDVRVVAVAVVDDRDGVYDEVGALVDRTCDVLRGVITDPLIVVGWSTGGIVAFELGQRLAAAGHRTALIGLVDTFFPGEHRRLWSNRWWKYKSMLHPTALPSVATELRLAVRRRVERLAARVGRRLLAFAGQTVPQERRNPTSPGGIPFIAMEHDPTPGPVPVVLYAATTTNPNRTELPWRQVAPDLAVVRISGRHRGHDSIMSATKVPAIADDLIERAAPALTD